jgi:DNA polymerase I-like protein with 3'-5' exonuclease and polymerase domains
MPQNFFNTYVLLDSETADWSEKDPITGALLEKKRTPHKAWTRLVQYSINGGPVVVLDLLTEEGKTGLNVLREYADGAALAVIQNALYDIPFLRKLGIHFQRFFDTQIASQILNAGIPMDHDLGALMDRYLGKRPYDEIGRAGIEAQAEVMRKAFRDYEDAFDKWVEDRDAEEKRLWADENLRVYDDGFSADDAPDRVMEQMKRWCQEHPVSVPCPENYMTSQQINEWVVQRLQGMKKDLQKSDWSLNPLTPEQMIYAATDVGPEFNELFLLLRQKIADGGFQKVFDLDMQVVPIVSEMAENGIKHHLYKWFDYIEERKVELAAIEEKITRLCDTELQTRHPERFMITLRRKAPKPGKPAKILKDGTVKTPEVPAQTVGDLMAIQPKPELTPAFEVLDCVLALENGDYRVGSIIRAELGLAPGEKFNITSAQQMRKLVDELMGVEWDAKHNFDDKAVEDLKKEAQAKGIQVVVDLLTMHQEAQGLRKLTQTYGESYWGVADPGGYIHSSFTLAMTDTARMSSRDPNLQNLPRPMQKMLWSCEDDEVIIKADYSAQELRLILFLGKQWDLYQKVLEGLDPHSMSAFFATGKPYEELVIKTPGKKDKVKPEYEDLRSKYKPVTFAPPFGCKPGKIAEIIGCDYKTAKKFYDNYWKTYDKVKVMQDNQIKSGVELGFVTDLSFGRMRWFMPTPADQERLDAGESREDVMGRYSGAMMNFAAQCTGGTIIRFAMLKVAPWLRRIAHTGAKIRLAVHDALILTCKRGHEKEVSDGLQTLMEAVAREVLPGIEIPVDVDIIADHTAPRIFTQEGYEEWKATKKEGAH